MTEEQHLRYTTWLQAIGLLGAAIGAVIALLQYSDFTKKQFEAPVWEKQVELYTSATETIARLAYAKDQDEWNQAHMRFWELYAGSLILVEDDDVAKGMVQFGKKVSAIENDLDARDKSFKDEAISLSYLFRESLKRNVGSGLPALSGTPRQ